MALLRVLVGKREAEREALFELFFQKVDLLIDVEDFLEVRKEPERVRGV